MITWKPETAKVSELKNWDKNPRKITEDAFNLLKERIQKRGFHDVIKTDGKGTILSGNQRKRALEDLGIQEVTILTPNRDLTEEEKNAIGVESNRQDGMWDMEMLNNFEPEFLFGLGFNEVELAGISDPESETKYTHECPHCTKKIKLSNRVAKIEAIND